MALFKCKMCGGELAVEGCVSVAKCDYCGTQQTIPVVKNEGVQNLFNRANTLRIKSEFDKAEKIYEKIIQEDEMQAEAYWGLILCKYGIEYVEDPKTFERVPTCHRTSYDAVVTDENYKLAIKNADVIQKSLYEQEAKAIDEIQKGILAQAQTEEPYDVFICYKETDASGKRTQDSVIANDIYYQLTEEGYKVFYAAITLEEKLGKEYEPIIFAALNSAKVMLSIGTKPEYFNAVWVKNEWSRFLKMMKTDRNKILIPCYRDMDAYDLPEEFAHLQAQNMGKIGFINDIVRGIKKVIVKETPKMEPRVETKSVVVEKIVAQTGNINAILKRMFIFLEDGDWESADEYAEKALDIDPETALAYVGKLMSTLRVKRQGDLVRQAEPFDEDKNYKKAYRYADDALKAELDNYNKKIRGNKETARKDEIYKKAVRLSTSPNNLSCSTAYQIAQRRGEVLEAVQLFKTIPDWKDSTTLLHACEEKAEELRKDEIYEQAREALAGKDVNAIMGAKTLLQKIPGWKDSARLLQAIPDRIQKLKNDEKYRDANLNLEKDDVLSVQTAREQFLSLGTWRDATKLAEECLRKIHELEEKERIARENEEKERQLDIARRKKKNIIRATVAVGIAVVIIVSIIMGVWIKKEDAKARGYCTMRLIDGGYRVTGAENRSEIIIPSTYKGKPVVGIDDKAFWSCDSLTSVVIGDNVKSIGDEAFWGCDSLTSVVIGDSVKYIGDDAFSSCDNLTSVHITDMKAWCNISFDTREANPLYYANSLYLNNELVSELIIPDTITAIQPYAFLSCDSLTRAIIPDSVKWIGKDAFCWCDGLTSIVIPDSVSSIGEDAFFSCDRLTIYCEATSQPSGWRLWNRLDTKNNTVPVVWGYKGGLRN